MHELKYNDIVVETVEQSEFNYILLDDISKLSKQYEIGEIYLKKLCNDMYMKKIYSYFECIDNISKELKQGLNINQIIIKYGLDKELI